MGNGTVVNRYPIFKSLELVLQILEKILWPSFLSVRNVLLVDYQLVFTYGCYNNYIIILPKIL